MLHEAITKPYADFNYYKDEYKGSTITSQTAFDECYREAEGILDEQTFQRIPKIEGADDELVRLIKFSVCALADVCSNHRSALKRAATGITSENRDGYSVSYSSNNDIKRQFKNEAREVVTRYLSETGLLYRGGGPYAHKR